MFAVCASVQLSIDEYCMTQPGSVKQMPVLDIVNAAMREMRQDTSLFGGVQVLVLILRKRSCRDYARGCAEIRREDASEITRVITREISL